jgi:hypothetical protein
MLRWVHQVIQLQSCSKINPHLSQGPPPNLNDCLEQSQRESFLPRIPHAQDRETNGYAPGKIPIVKRQTDGHFSIACALKRKSHFHIVSSLSCLKDLIMLPCWQYRGNSSAGELVRTDSVEFYDFNMQASDNIRVSYSNFSKEFRKADYTIIKQSL